MNHDIRLYLAGQRCDLRDDPKILFNYKVTDTQKPAAVKNGFTKSIVLDGTDTNNAIFGQIWDLQRFQEYGNGNYYGTEFNPLKKADFSLYIDSDLYETGYFKLTEISKTGSNIQYTIQLFGGLGEFFHNLSATDGGNAMEFKDLRLYLDRIDTIPVPDLGFTISKDEVYSAWTADSWDNLYGNRNFAPCYNGTPDGDFEANKVMMNLDGRPTDLENVTGLSSAGRWALGTTDRGLSELEAHDFRSHMQRPVLRVKTLLDACFTPDNNGGYFVSLDDHFFNTDNPYYWDAWVTCPLIKDMQGTDEENSSEITGATIVKSGTTHYYDINATGADFSNFNNVTMDIAIGMSGETNTANRLYTSTSKRIKNTITLQQRFVKDFYYYYSSLLIQLVAFNEIGEVVGCSNAYQLTSKVDSKDPVEWMDLSGQMTEGNGLTIPDFTTLFGYFQKSGSTYNWVDYSGNEQLINFRFPENLKYYKLKLRVQRPYYQAYKLTAGGGNRRFTSADYATRMYASTTGQIQGNHEPATVIASGSTFTTPIFEARNFHATATRYGGFLSGKYISQDRLLTLGITPADFLISYIKLFGLHIWKDPVEKTIYIADRNSYYTDETQDINHLIDRGRQIKITPQVAQARWYDFNTEQVESAANKQYSDTYGTDYGLQRVNTSFDFDSNTEAAYDGKFKGGIQVLENSPYFYGDYNSWPVFCYNGFALTQYHADGLKLVGNETKVDYRSGVDTTPWNEDYKGFDLIDKPQFHTADGTPADGSLVLLFRDTEGRDITAAHAFITDDIDEMITRNGGKPCWINTAQEDAYSGQKIGRSITAIPHFTRMLYWQNMLISHTWDYGRTQETYIPGTTLTEGCSIYERFWKNYINDMYSVNSRKLTCNALLRGQVTSEMLRDFYWWDNSIWRLNEIKEHNPGGFDTTAVEFLKVNDPENYKLARCTKDPELDFWLPDYTPISYEESDYTRRRTYEIPSGTTAVTGYIKIQDGGPWTYGDGAGAYAWIDYSGGTSESIAYSALTESHDDGGVGNTAEVFNIGANTSGSARTIHLNILIYGSAGDHWRYVDIIQPSGTGPTPPTPPTPETALTVTISDYLNPYSATGGTKNGSVVASGPWTGNTDSAWLTLTPSAGTSGTTSISVAAAANGTDSARTGNVLVALEGGGPARLTLSQEAGSGPTPPTPGTGITATRIDSGNISNTGGTATIQVTSDTPWTGTTAWLPNPDSAGSSYIPEITITPSSGPSGTTNVTMEIEGTYKYTLETARATFTNSSGNSASVDVIQDFRPAINIGMVGNTFDAEGGTHYGEVTANGNWRLDSLPSWLTITPNSGTASEWGSTAITVTTAQNTTGAKRSETVRARLINNPTIYDYMNVYQTTGSTGPTQTTILYNLAGQFETNSINLEITIVSYGGYSDTANLIGLSGNQQSETGNIDVMLEHSGQTLGFIIKWAGGQMDPSISGYFEIRCAYNMSDTGYQQITMGNSVQFSETYTTGAAGTLYIDMIWRGV